MLLFIGNEDRKEEHYGTLLHAACGKHFKGNDPQIQISSWGGGSFFRG